MQFEIKLLVDDSSPLNPEDAGGTVIFHQGKHESRSDYVLLDTWFSELLNSYTELTESEDESWVDFSEESGSLCFRIEGGKLSIDYKDSTFALPKTQFESALTKAIKELLSHFPDRDSLLKTEYWPTLLKFVKE